MGKCVFLFKLTGGDVLVASPTTPTLPHVVVFTCRGVRRLLRLLELTVEVLRQYGVVSCGEVRPQDGTAQCGGEYRLLRQKQHVSWQICEMSKMIISSHILCEYYYVHIFGNSN